MKKLTSLFVGVLLLCTSFAANAQAKTGADFFKGKWSVLVKDTPNGDAKMIFVLDKSGDKITGVVQDSTGKEMTKITEAELKGNEVTLYFTTQGYDVNLLLTKKDDDHASGSLMGMFDAVADRVKEQKIK